MFYKKYFELGAKVMFCDFSWYGENSTKNKI